MVRYEVKMSNKELYTKLIIIVFIISLGFLIRIDSTYLPSKSNDKKIFYQDSSGLPYMFEMDSYYNYRLTQNLLDHGYLGDNKIDGMEWDLHSYYPPGVPLDYPPLIAYLSSLIYHLINLFASIPLLNIVFWISPFFAPLSGIIAYFMVRKFTNDYGAVAAGIFIVTAPLYTVRTIAGWFDTDMFNIFFPLLVTWLFFEAVDHRNNLRKGILLAVATAFSMFFFSLAWNGFQYIFYFIVIFSILYFIWCKFKGRKVQNLVYIFLVFFLGSLLLIGVLSGFINIFKLFNGPLELIKVSQNPWAPWPDVYTTVSELNRPGFVEIASNLGLAFFAGLLGYIWIFRFMINKKLKDKFLTNMNWFFYLYLLLWAVVGFFSLLKGNRFSMLLLPPMAISAGIFIGIVVDYLFLLRDSYRFDIFRRRKNLLNILAILILVGITIPALYNDHQSISSITPLTNDDLWSTSEWINNHTSNDTVVICQWSYGHLFTAIADRPVVFDGRMGYIETLSGRNFGSGYPYGDKSPGIYREYWISKAFTTSNETLSEGIFEMLASSGDLAYLTLNNYTKNTTKSVEILNNILGVDRGAANQTLLNNYHLNQEQVNNILKYTHPDNITPYVLVTTDGLLGIGESIFEYGEWDFNKNQGVNHTYYWNYFNITHGILNTSDGLKYDMVNGDIIWNNKKPHKIIIITDGKINKKLVDENSDFDVILLMDNKKAIIIDKNYESSLFTKLIIEKSNSTNFEEIYRTNTIIVWKSKK